MRKIMLALALALLLPAAQAQEESNRTIKFARQPAISPDARTIAFSYLGDIWTVPASGGTAARLTIHEAHDQLPSWSPDGKWIAFSSKREGNYDVWLIPAAGGRARQLTVHSADDLVSGWSPDSKQILFTSQRETTRVFAIYTVDVAAGATRMVAEDDFALTGGAFTHDGKRVGCTRGGSMVRKGYRGSANSNLMLFPVEGGPGEWLSREPENERWTLFHPDGKSVFYASDKGGSTNLWRMTLPGRKSVQLTRHTGGNLFYPSLSANGEKIAYEQDFSIRTLSTRGGQPTEVRITAPTDERSNSLRRETFTTGAQEARLSPDGKQIALVVHGEIFVQPAAGGDAVRLSHTAQREQDVEWSPDGNQLVFASDRAGSSDLYTVDMKSKEVKPVSGKREHAEHTPRISPDGRSLCFLRGYNGTELCMVPLAGGEPKVLASDPAISSPVWSPDSRWIAYHRTKAHSAGQQSEVFIVNVTEGKPVNVSRYPVQNTQPRWSRDGRRLYFLSDRTGNTNIWSVSLRDEPREDREMRSDPAAPGNPDDREGDQAGPELKVDLEDIHRRARQVTRVESGVSSYAVSPDGRSIVFAMSQLGRTDLWRIAAIGGSPVRLTQTGESGSGMQFAPDGSKVYYLSGGLIKTISAAPPAAAPGAASPAMATVSTVPFSARMDIDTREELTQMFDEAWRKVRDAFYDEKMHGVDWSKVRETYRPLLADISYKEDFYYLFSLVLGELNASHTGLGGRTGSGGGQSTASLGVAFDDRHTGPGVKVKSVMPRGPASRDENRLQPGDIILKVDGQQVLVNEQLYRLLADKSGRTVELLVNSKPSEEGAKTVKIRAISVGQYRQLEYDRWVREREQATEKLSNGKLGYLHLNSMNNENLEKFKRAVFGDMQEKDGLVIDVRFNGGGAIADEMLAIMQDRIFSYRTMRGDPGRLTAPLQVWTKPTIVLINEASFSNAEAFPWGYKALKLGKVVGVPTFGAVIGTGGTTLIDGSVLRIPSVGAYTLEGLNMENNGCPPDVYVENTPEDVQAGRDRQLERAVSELAKSL